MEIVYIIYSHIAWKVSKKIYIIILFIEEKYKLLLKEKQNFYKKINQDDIFVDIEKTKIKNIIKFRFGKYGLKELYYSLDNRNIFKRLDRYYLKKSIIIIFIFMCVFNLSEIILAIFFSIQFRPSSEYSPGERIITVFFNMIYIFVTQILSYLSVSKLDIKTYIFY